MEFFTGQSPVKKYGKQGFIDLNGKVVTPLIYDNAGNFVGGKVRVKKDDKWGFIDLNCNIV